MLGPAETATLAAMLERLVPGAAEAQVPRFVGRLLEHDSELVAAYRAGLAQLTGFAGLEPQEQDARLRALEGDSFFELVRLHAIQGMFADPAHGGNAGYAGWDLIGFPGVKVVFGARDQALDVDVEATR
jgi:hypothetical protein